jgi:hypothetical protein
VQADEARLREARCDARFELRGEVDFGDEQQHLATSRQCAFDQAQVDLGLATARHAKQEVGFETVAACRDGGQHRLLLGGQFGRFVRRR